MSEQEKQYYRNLLDAGCPAKRADEYMALFLTEKYGTVARTCSLPSSIA